jgi:bifunctional UDP-N-acetylglucosamine pyrophosphorylase/glucosamine-1-phosphate N-acetyltransferase
MTGAGSVISKNIPDGALGLGRARQKIKEGFALKILNKLKNAKIATNKD